MYRAAHRLAQPLPEGEGVPCMGPAHGQAMHPRSAIALQIKDAAPNENSRDVLSKNLGSALSC